jgi:hypothetical protein
VRFPEQHFTAAVLCNFADTNPSSLTRQVADIVLAKEFREPASAPVKEANKPTGVLSMTADQLKAVAGTYWKRDGDDYQRIVVKNGALLLDLGGDEYHPLKPLSESHFRVADVPWSDHMDLHFVAATNEKPARIEQSWDGDKPDVYEWVQTVDPSPLQLAEYAGPYVSEEIDPVYRFEVRAGELTLLRLKNKPDPLRPAAQDVFTGRLGTVRFTRDASHHLTGFVLDAGRIQGLTFTKRAGL